MGILLALVGLLGALVGLAVIAYRTGSSSARARAERDVAIDANDDAVDALGSHRDWVKKNREIARAVERDRAHRRTSRLSAIKWLLPGDTDDPGAGDA